MDAALWPYGKCKNCANKNYCAWSQNEILNCMNNGYLNYSPMRNADRLRSMTDEELAAEMTARGGCPHDCEDPDDIDTDCYKCWLDWLKEATE